MTRLQRAPVRSLPARTLSGFAVVVASAGVVFADIGGEQAALAQLDQELYALGPLIEMAEAQSDPDARIRFQYDWLRQDLDRIRLGIIEHLSAPRNQPRKIEPLRGDYRQ